MYDTIEHLLSPDCRSDKVMGTKAVEGFISHYHSATPGMTALHSALHRLGGAEADWAIIGAPVAQFDTRDSHPEILGRGVAHERQENHFCGQHVISQLIGGTALSPFQASMLKAWILQQDMIQRTASYLTAYEQGYSDDIQCELALLEEYLQQVVPDSNTASLKTAKETLAAVKAVTNTLEIDEQNVFPRELSGDRNPGLATAVSPKHMMLLLRRLVQQPVMPDDEHTTFVTSIPCLLRDSTVYGKSPESWPALAKKSPGEFFSVFPTCADDASCKHTFVVGDQSSHWFFLTWLPDKEKYAVIDSEMQRISAISWSDMPAHLVSLQTVCVIGLCSQPLGCGAAAGPTTGVGVSRYALSHLQATMQSNLKRILAETPVIKATWQTPGFVESIPIVIVSRDFVVTPVVSRRATGPLREPDDTDLTLPDKTTTESGVLRTPQARDTCH